MLPRNKQLASLLLGVATAPSRYAPLPASPSLNPLGIACTCNTTFCNNTNVSYMERVVTAIWVQNLESITYIITTIVIKIFYS